MIFIVSTATFLTSSGFDPSATLPPSDSLRTVSDSREDVAYISASIAARLSGDTDSNAAIAAST